MAAAMQKKFWLVLAAVVLGLSLLCAGAFVFTGPGHDCEGAHCTVCAELHIAGQILESLVKLCISALAAALVFFVQGKIKTAEQSFPRPTQVSLKIKFNS